MNPRLVDLTVTGVSYTITGSKMGLHHLLGLHTKSSNAYGKGAWRIQQLLKTGGSSDAKGPLEQHPSPLSRRTPDLHRHAHDVCNQRQKCTHHCIHVFSPRTLGCCRANVIEG